MRRFTVAGESMAPALHEGDIVYCRRMSGRVQRGDLVVFRHPRQRALMVIKRVVGLPSEHLAIEFGTVLADGKPDLDVWGDGFTFPEGEWHIGPDEVFVLSDNRNATRDDSRTFGPVPLVKMRRVWWLVRVGGAPPTH